MASAGNVAKYIIKLLPVDNLKLQKLLYYSQAVYLVLNDKNPLFPEAIEAWDYGPVVPLIYREYKRHGFETIPPLEDTAVLEMPEMKAIDLALSGFGDMSGAALINQTHAEPPWKNSYRAGRPSGVISIDSMYAYFKDSLEFTEDEIQAAV